MRRRRRRAVVLVTILAIGPALAACGDDDTTDAAPTSSSTTAAPDATTSTTAPEETTSSAPTGDAPVPDGSGCTPGPGPLPDGRWYGLVDAASDGELSFDLACWFSMPDAEIAAAEDGEESPPPNDYHVRNDDPTLRTVPVADGTTVVWYPSGRPDDHPTIGYDEWRTARDARDHQLAVWLDVESGAVTAIEEQWVP